MFRSQHLVRKSVPMILVAMLTVMNACTDYTLTHIYPEGSDTMDSNDWGPPIFSFDSGTQDAVQDASDSFVPEDLAPEPEADTADPPDTTPAPNCGDGLQNGGEEEVDCGGPCPACVEPTIFDEACGGLPTPANTGVLDETLLSPSGGMTVTEDGTLIENLDITGSIDIRANNVTVRNVRVNGTGTWYAIRTDRRKDGKAHQYPWTGILIEHVEAFGTNSSIVLAGGQGNAPGEGVTIRHSYFHDSGSDATKLRSNVLMECSFYHRLGTNPGAHADGTQIRKGRNTEIRYNNCELSVSDSDDFVGSPYKTNACVMASAELGPLDNIKVHHNRLQGGNYTVYITVGKDGEYPATNCTIKDNIFGSNYRFGVWQINTSVDIEGNICESTGDAPVEKQCPCPEGAKCGQK